jgi:hypothetical protein
MKTTYSSETSVNFNQITRRHIPEYRLLWGLIFWHTRLYSQVKVNRRFGTYRFNHSGRRVRKARNYHEFSEPEDRSDISFWTSVDRYYIPEGRAFRSDRSTNLGSRTVKSVARQWVSPPLCILLVTGYPGSLPSLWMGYGIKYRVWFSPETPHLDRHQRLQRVRGGSLPEDNGAKTFQAWHWSLHSLPSNDNIKMREAVHSVRHAHLYSVSRDRLKKAAVSIVGCARRTVWDEHYHSVSDKARRGICWGLYLPLSSLAPRLYSGSIQNWTRSLKILYHFSEQRVTRMTLSQDSRNWLIGWV